MGRGTTLRRLTGGGVARILRVMCYASLPVRRMCRAWAPEAPRLGRIMWVCFLFVLLGLLLPPSSLAARNKSPTKPKGITHVVEPGQTLFRISQAYGLPIAALLEANHLRPSAPLRVGQRLFIPGAAAPRKVESFHPLTRQERSKLEESLRDEVAAPPAPEEMPRPHVKTDAPLVWPILGPINSPFGPRWGKFHAGIDIGSPHYQEVVAAADGEVIYANGTNGGLGKAVVIQHAQGLRTVYAHLSIIIAHESEAVRQGQAVGGVGATGHATGPHLHFEVRRNGIPVNPEDYLPATIDELVKDLSRGSQADLAPAGAGSSR